ncbi:MAG TPA: glycosyl hydrolase family 65 protein [Solirubrobacteraceae bacterium]|nr:glycosyl hydrolase family 65 protein [Solirubrobacteraceae bacterium]
MISAEEFPVEPWAIRETQLTLDRLAQTESIFALSNGHIGMRGNLDEGEPFGIPGSYLAGFCELRPLPYAEPAYGYPESDQTIVNVTDAKIIRLLVDDEPFDLRYGTVESHERVLDLRAGVLRREVVWSSPSGARVRVTSTRLVSLTHRAVAAITWAVEPLDASVRVVVQSELVANEEPPTPDDADPRAGNVAPLALEHVFGDGHDLRALLVHATQESGLRMAAAMQHHLDGPADLTTSLELSDDVARVIITADLEPGQSLSLEKFCAYGWSAQRSTPALRDQVSAALVEAERTGFDGLLAQQRQSMDDFWQRADIEIDGDPELQQATRFALFHVMQAGIRGEQRAIGAKGLTGPGYDGHTFWDNESFVLPVLTYTLPHAAADSLRWRHHTLELARQRARLLHLRGAAFPWRTIRGEECSGYWPAGTAAFHINADIAAAVLRHQQATGDAEFEAEVGLELLVETARLWASLGHHDADGGFRIDGVTGPDEYSAVQDNNVYTNLMARANLRGAANAAMRHRERAEALGVDLEEIAAWRDAAEAMVVPYDERLGVHPQSEGFTAHDRFDFTRAGPEQYPLMFHFPFFDLYRKQVVKQADLVLALHLCGDAFSLEEKRRNFEYYEPLTVRDSSLSACTQAVIAAEVGHLELAYAYAREAALMDLNDLEHNVTDGVHIAALAGAWTAAVAGFGGMRDVGGELSFAPRLPEKITRLAFRLYVRDIVLSVTIEPDSVEYRLDDGQELELRHHGRRFTLAGHRPQTLAIPPLERRQAPRQPPHRAPGRGI